MKPPHVGWAMLVAGILVGFAILSVTWTLARVSLRAEAKALHVLADSLAGKCVFYMPDTTGRPAVVPRR